MNVKENLKILLTEEQIKKEVKRLGQEISKDYKNKNLIIIGVLKGAFMFLSDLIREIKVIMEIEFIELSSYRGKNTESSGEIKIIKDVHKNLSNKHVLVVEDIVDTGFTISFLRERVRKENPASLKVCSLTSKPARREKKVNIDYLGFEVPNKFVVGYGIDYDEKYRNLREIYFLEEE
ncbi:MAG: Hypoxanthine-guanine phosphoribosyltransferase [Promethearchaeota archaeon]|nr:MAG: Hypoxanthine-guanine phosphoribosyltransferase [Candidatus Lokiarchaeota archaeon]